MRILMVSDVYFPRVNGVSTSIETFRRTLAALGVELRLVAPRYGAEPDEPGVVRVPGWPVPGDREDRLVGWRAMHRAVLAAAEGCDLVHIQTPFVAHYAGLAAARRLGLPVIATYHTLFEEYLQHYAPWLPAGWLKRRARGLSRRQCNALDGVIVPSTAMRERLLGYGVGVPLHVLRRASRSIASGAATGRPSGPATASRRSVLWRSSSAGWPTRRTSASCSMHSSMRCASDRTCCC